MTEDGPTTALESPPVGSDSRDEAWAEIDRPTGATGRGVPTKIITGGQTGADQAALRTARADGIPTGS
jgi:hypothetical protein